MKKILPFLLLTTIIQCKIIAQQETDNSQEQMYMLTYDHGGLILWGSDHFREQLESATSWLDKYPGFKIGLDNEAHMYDYISEYDPELLQDIQETLKKYKGRFGIGTCTYGQPLSQFINEESNIRQIGYAIRSLDKHFSYEPEIYIMSEHAMHSQIPQILDGFGFNGAIMRTHFMMYGYNPTFNQAIGWWKGMDGSRIATIPTYEGEGAEFFKTTVDNWILTRYPSDDATQSLADFRNEFAHINPLLASRADDSGLRKEELVKEYEGNHLFKWILLEEIPEIFPEPTVDFVTRPDDFTVRMPWGYCGNKIWNDSRKAEVQALTAERLATFEFLNNGINREQELSKAWQNLLVAQHHDIQIVGLTHDADLYLSESMNYSSSVLDSSLSWAAGRMSASGVQQITVFNPLSWKRKAWIHAKISFVKGQANVINVEKDGVHLPVAYLQRLLFSDNSIYEAEIAFEATLPPLSICSYSIQAGHEERSVYKSGFHVDRENLRLETPFYLVNLDRNGGIASLIDLRTNTPVFNPEKRSAFFAGTINSKDEESHGRWIISGGKDDSPWITAIEKGFISDIPYTLEVKFYSNTPRIDCLVEFNFNGQMIGQVSDNKRDRESAFIHDRKLRFKCFPFLPGKITGMKDLPFIITSTDNPNIEGSYWTALENGKKGIAYFNKGTMGSLREEDESFSIPLSYSMYYIWGTRILEEDYSYEFSIFPYNSDWKTENVHREALTYNFPAVYRAGKPGNGELGSQIDLLDLDSMDVLLSALYVKDGDVFVRCYESRGESTSIKPVNRIPGTEYFPVDLKGSNIGPPIKIWKFRPWEIKTFKVKTRKLQPIEK